jgi:hypothetical protein
VIKYDGIAYGDNYFSLLNANTYVNTSTGTNDPQIVTSSQFNYACPAASVPIFSNDGTLNGCYTCPDGSSMLITRDGPNIVANSPNGDEYPLTQYQ